MAPYVEKLKKAEKDSWREVQRLFTLHVKKPWPQMIRVPAKEVTQSSFATCWPEW